jgi:NAD(P)-dependent dehydrogenase (short-subunit alcohol dehydrogenase family)
MAMDGRIVVVTGASRGLGAAVALACARAGAQLVLVAKTRGALEEVDDGVRAAGGAGATLVAVDLREGELVDKLGAALFERFGRLDGLVLAHAELGLLTPVSHLKPDVLADTMAVNLLATHRLIRTLDPLLRMSPAGRVVALTCEAARVRKAYWGPYAASKAALEALVTCWAGETERTSMRINLVDPGPMATRLRRRAFPGEAPDTQPAPELRAPAILDLLQPTSERHGELVRLG